MTIPMANMYSLSTKLDYYIRYEYFEVALCNISMSQLQAIVRFYRAWHVDCRAAFKYLALLKRVD